MPKRSINAALGQLHKLLSPEYHLSDEQLLDRFVTQRDEEAFAALFKRHGAMVLGVCQSVLRHTQDAEDTCQASFLVLARKASSIRTKESLGSWLHGVAYRLARKLEATRTRTHAEGTRDRPPSNPLDELSWREVRQIIHVELQRLPRSYQLPLIFCYLEGQTQDEAAKRLAWTAATVKGRLDRGREMLRKRLTRRGLALEVTLLTTILAPGSSSAALASATVRAAMLFVSGQPLGTGISAQAVALVHEGIKAMLVTKLKMTVALVLTLGALAGGAGMVAHQAGARDQPVVKKNEEPRAPQIVGTKTPEAKLEDRPRVDVYGDLLPPRTVARIGTSRLFARGSGRDPGARYLAYTPDGKSLLSGGGKIIRFWDTRNGKELRQVQIPGDDQDDGNYTFALAPDGKTLVTASLLSTSALRLWDVATCKELRELTGNKNGNSLIAFSPDGKSFAAAGPDGVRIWNVSTWHQTQLLPTADAFSFAFVGNDKNMVTAARDGLRWWNMATGREVRHLAKELDYHSWLAVSPDGKRLAIVAGKFIGEANPVGHLQICDASTGEEVRAINLGSGSGWCLGFSPDSQTLLCLGTSVRFFAADTGREFPRWEQDKQSGQMIFSPDGKTLAHASQGVIQLLDVKTGKRVLNVPRLPAVLTSVGFISNGTSLMADCWGGQIGIWDSLTGKQLTPLWPPPKEFGSRAEMLLGTAITADGKKAALVDAKGVLHVWEPLTRKEVCSISEPKVGEDAAIFSPDGKTVAIKHQDHVTRLWDSTSGKLLHSLPLQNGLTGHWFPHPRAFSRDGRYLATAPQSDQDRTIRVWETATGKESRRFALDDNTYLSYLLFTPDSKRLITANYIESDAAIEAKTEDASWRLWDLATGREVRRFSAPVSEFKQAAALSPDGKTLAAAAHNAIVFWELATGKERSRFGAEHRDLIWSMAFSQDGRLLASGSLDHTALIWDVTGISPDGKLALDDVNPEELKRLWSNLDGADGVSAYRAMWKMVAAQRQSIPFLAERLRPVPGISGERIARLITELDSDDFKVRTQASKELEQMGDLAEPALSKVLAGKPSLEMRQRASRLLDALFANPLSAEQIHALRALEVLEHVATPEARHVLEELAKGAPGARLTNEARASLERLLLRATRSARVS